MTLVEFFIDGKMVFHEETKTEIQQVSMRLDNKEVIGYARKK